MEQESRASLWADQETSNKEAFEGVVVASTPAPPAKNTDADELRASFKQDDAARMATYILD